MSGILGEYTEVFLEESEDQIEELNSNLLILEKDHNDREIINDIFRAAHSLKSSAAFVGLYNLSDLAHKMENLLQKIREDKLEVNLQLVNLLFECFDLIKEVIDSVGNGIKVDTDFSEMIKKLEDYESGSSPTVEKKSTPTTNGTGKPTETERISKEAHQISVIELEPEEERDLEEEIKEKKVKVFDISVKLKSDTPMKGLRFALILQNCKDSGIIFKSSPDDEELEKGTDRDSIEFIFISGKSEKEIQELLIVDMVESIQIQLRVVQLPHLEKQVEHVEHRKEFAIPDKDVEGKSVVKSIKVASEKLDHLMNNVGELVITNSGFQKIYDDLIKNFGEDSLFAELKSKIDQINRISKDLQTGIMNTRMVPIGSVFNRFTRLVRDLCIETGKKIELVLQGENTELDKKVVDVIGEPLMHLIRNSIDHGIESPEERIKKGKPETGTIRLNAFQGGNNIMVEISDDGKGLDREKILNKAVKNGLITSEDGAGLPDSEVYQFIFAAGFSTAEKITDISGRGVGMNVVNKLIQEFKGKIIINSISGQGTSFTLCFPQALAIISSILVTVEEEMYAFPLSEVVETIRVNKDQITTLEGHDIINLRGEVLPIYTLSAMIGLNPNRSVTEVPIVIVNYNSRKLGFIVDDLIGKHETVIKSLDKNYKNIQGLTGASIMGDGTIILVLDVPGLVEMSSIRDSQIDTEFGAKLMKRLGASKSLDMDDSDSILKTLNPTNVFNDKLLEILLKDKSRQKRKKAEQSRKLISIEESVTISKPDFVVEDSIQSPVLKIESTENEKPVLEIVAVEPEKVEPKVEDVEKEKEKEIIQNFRAQTQERFSTILPERHINELLTKEETKKLETIVNTGMMNAGLVLSQLVGSNVELYIPEISLTDKEELIQKIPNLADHYFGLKVRMNGDLNGNLLMMFSEEVGKKLSDDLLKSKENTLTKKISDDSKSVLSEISNIVCSSIINSLSNKSKSQIMPSVPEFISGSFREVLDIVKPEKTRFLMMHTEFIHEGGNLLGDLLFLPDFDELVKLISKM
ncbi:MAG: chemotaxis protein CheW [Leptospiraceae bacterium]|nr:chemotaxis protein CheW [Leptospiraceae bacterium]MCK6380993.1 chemotaxis protein CheW [Leptospiraceae bacterium]NUM40254.1 chemotaxis protein CheW [Leptospiraceae bacterium]